MRKQLAAMPYWPSEAGAIEVVTTRVRAWMEGRAFSFRNRARTNLLLGLMTNELAGDASARNYTRRIRDHLLQPTLAAVIPRGLIFASSRLH